ncbi:MAG: hypothetical protein ABEI96_02860 [Haloarculaceae archaeon]
MPYELDSTDDADEESTANDHADEDPTANSHADESVGVRIPDEHAGAFVAEAFEDPERDTDWEDVVDALVAPAARDAWDALSARRQTVEVLDAATDYDERAVDHLSAALDEASHDVETRVDEALRCRRNADTFRDGVADAYASGRLDDDALREAVTASRFDSGPIAERERLLQRVDETVGVDYRPYGGTLFDDADGPDASVDHGVPETW